MVLAKQLPQDVESLQELVQKKNAEIIRLNEIITFLRRQHYGPRSEKKKVPGEQLELQLFNEAEELAKKEKAEEQKKTITYERGRPKRKPLPENLPREDVVIELSEEERRCHCGCQMEEIGEEVSEKLDVIPMQVKVIRTHRKKYACKKCEENIQTAPVPEQILPKSMAAEGLLSFIIVSKFIEHLPLYRLEKLFLRVGVELPRTTMARWMIEVALKFMPLLNLMREELIESAYIRSDETRVQVLDEPGKKAESLSYMWVQARAGPHPIILYTYDPTRKKEVPIKLLEGFQGFFQVDGYGGYDKFCEIPGVIRIGCWAHARRKFFDATKVKAKPGLSNKGLKFIQRLYQVEDETKSLGFEERKDLRVEKSKPIADEFRLWLDEVLPQVPPKTALGKALGYADREWVYLTRYLENGELEIDNNFIENKIRPFALGRKNWLFSQSVEGAESSAALFSLIETAQANGLNPDLYIRALCERIPHAKTLEDFEALLPWNVKLI